MAPFDKSLTLGDVMGTLYGENSKIIAGILGFLTTICVAGMELIVLGLLCESLLGLDYRWGVGLGGLILSIYSAHGGIKAVTATDVFQFLVLLIVLPVIAVWALDYAGGIRAVLDQVPVMKMQVVTHPQALYYLIMLILLDILQVGMVDPATMQRLLMARSQRQLRNQFFVLSIISPAVQLTSMLLALTGIVLYPTLEGAQVVPQIIKDLLPVGIKGLAMAGFFAVSMGNIDSYLHAAGITLVHDIVKPICDKFSLGIDELRWAKYATMFVSVFSIAIGLTKTNGLYNLLFVSYECTPILVFPLWSGILGLKPDKYAFYLAAGVTTVVLFLCKFLLPVAQSHFVVFIGLAANGIVFFCTHAIRNHGFQVIVVNPTNRKEYLWKPHRKALLTWLAHLMPTLSGIIQYSQRQVAKYDAPYLLLGSFCVVNYIIPYFMWAYEGAHSEIILSLRLVGALACGLLLVRDKWPQSLLPYLPTLWHLTLLYCLSFTSTVMFLLTQGSMECLVNVALTIMFLIVLVDWLSFIIRTVLGVVLGLLFYTLAIGPIQLQLDFSTGYLLAYTCIFFTLISLLFARRKEQFFEARLRAIGEEHATVRQAGALPHPATQRIATVIDRQVREFLAIHNQQPICDTEARHADAWSMSPDFLHYFFPTALEVIRQGTHMRKHLTQVITTEYLAPQLALHSLKSCLEAIVATYAARYEQEMATDLSEDYPIHTSLNYLQYVVVHVLQFLHAHHLEAKVRLWISQPEGIHIRLPGQAVSASLVQELLSLFPLKETARNMGLAISRLLIEAHGGHLLCKTCSLPGQAYTEFVLVIPPAEAKVEVSVEPT
ncbi:MAG: hypothetical protein MUC61_02605 [Amoebophilaceae bacterium]|jgi:Na+/proline symporter|nr:hypothetical protein [Amoebophilaceae bacterium]